MSRGTESLNCQFFFFVLVFCLMGGVSRREREPLYPMEYSWCASFHIKWEDNSNQLVSDMCQSKIIFLIWLFVLRDDIPLTNSTTSRWGKLKKKKYIFFFIDWISFLVPCWHSQNWNNLVSFCPFVEFPAVYIPLVFLVFFFLLLLHLVCDWKLTDKKKERMRRCLFITRFLLRHQLKLFTWEKIQSSAGRL